MDLETYRLNQEHPTLTFPDALGPALDPVSVSGVGRGARQRRYHVSLWICSAADYAVPESRASRSCWIPACIRIHYHSILGLLTPYVHLERVHCYLAIGWRTHRPTGYLTRKLV